MIYLLIFPLSRVKTETTDVDLYKKIPLEIEQTQDQFSNILTDSNILGKELTEKFQNGVKDTVCAYKELIFSPRKLGQNNWLNVNVVGERTCNHPLQKRVEITFGSTFLLNNVIKKELEKYKFALYLYKKSGYDLMSWRQPFKERHFYEYSLELNPDDVHISPSHNFEETVRRNYIDEKSVKDETYFLLIFREDKSNGSIDDLLLIYD